MYVITATMPAAAAAASSCKLLKIRDEKVQPECGWRNNKKYQPAYFGVLF